MTAAVYATPADVEKLWQGDAFGVPETQAAEDLLEFASAVLRTYLPKLDVWLADGTIESVLVRGVTRDMVLRVMRNPDMVRSEQVDDYAQTWDTTLLRQGLTPTSAELRLLKPPPSSTAARSPVGVAHTRPAL